MKKESKCRLSYASCQQVFVLNISLVLDVRPEHAPAPSQFFSAALDFANCCGSEVPPASGGRRNAKAPERVIAAFWRAAY